MKLRIAALAVAAMVSFTVPAAAWENKGHEMVNGLAAKGLAGRVPAFVTTPQALNEIEYLGPQLDRLKGSGTSWDSDYDPGHYIDVDDNGMVAGIIPLDTLPVSAKAFDEALQSAKTDQYRVGYLPYSILDGWEQLRDDFAYWRVDKGAARAIDEQLIVRDIGVWGHYIADACQPLHTTVHFNGWGDYPNPNGYTESKETHAMFEGWFVDHYVNEAAVAALVPKTSTLAAPKALLPQATVMAEIERYLLQGSRTVPQLYAIEKAGGFAKGSPEAVQFTAARLAAGATEMRDLTVWAWQDSINASIGFPAKPVRDILSGKAK